MLQLVFAYGNGLAPVNDLRGGAHFGLNQGLPWKHLSQDLKNFKARTQDTMLIMGANTFMSLPGLLPGRTHIVVQDLHRSNVQAKDGCFADYYVNEYALRRFLTTNHELLAEDYNGRIANLSKEGQYSIIGGPAILSLALPYADQIIVSKITKKAMMNSDVKLDQSFIHSVIKNEMVETHFWVIDEITTLTETVYKVDKLRS